MTKKRIIIFGLLVLIFLAVGSYALAQPTGTEATLLVTNGDVTVSQPQNFFFFSNNQQTNLTTGDILLVKQGDTIKVASASFAVLTMGDGTSAELFSNTVVEVAEFFADDTNFRVSLSLMSGKIVNRVQRLLTANDAYDVQTPSSTASVRGTVFIVDVVSEQESFYSVDEGIVAVQMGEQEVMVKAGFEVTAVTGQPLVTQPQSPESSAAFSESERLTAVESQPAQTGEQPESENVPDAQTNGEQDAVGDDSHADEPGVAEENAGLKEIISDQDPDDDGKETDGSVSTAVPDRATTPILESTAVPTRQTSGSDSPNSPQSPTAQPTSLPGVTTPITNQPTATTKSTIPTATDRPTTVPPTAVPPTAVPPTAVPPTAVPPTAVPPTAVPPTAVPPTAVPPTAVPPTAVPPTAVPPTAVPPTAVPPTAVPPTAVPPTAVPPTAVPPTAESAKVTICHNGNTISVDESSVQSHLDHGDSRGSCP